VAFDLAFAVNLRYFSILSGVILSSISKKTQPKNDLMQNYLI